MRPTPLLAVLLAAAALPVSAQSYRFTDLGAPRPDLLDLRGLINNRGTIAVTGAVPLASIPEPEEPWYNPEPDRGWAFRNGTYARIPRPPNVDLPGDRLMAVNDLDEMVGYFFTSYDNYYSFWYHARSGEQRSLRSFVTREPPQHVGLLFANGLTNSGVVLGAEINDYDLPWLLNLRNGELTSYTHDLGLEYPVAYAINHRNWVSLYDINGGSFLHRAGTSTLQPTPFVGQAISDSQILASTQFNSPQLHLWHNGTPRTITLPGNIAEPYPSVVPAIAINDWGQVVGTYQKGTGLSAFVYDGCAVRDLNDVVPATDRAGWTLTRASGINDLGQIVGTMRNSSGQRRLFLLTPAPTALSGGHWDDLGFAPQAGTFTLRYDAVPMAGNLDGVTGLSLTPANTYTDLAVIVRFNTNGRVDARNGNYYRAVNSLTYVSGLAYRIELTVNLSARRFSATVTPAGGEPVVIAKDSAFRAELSKATHLDTLNAMSLGGAVALGSVQLAPATLGPISSTNGRWANLALPPKTGAFTLRFRVTPGSRPIDGAVGLSLSAADDINDLATTLRFTTGGRVDARNGGRYAAVRSFSYQAGTTYDVVMNVNVATHRYSATITAPGGTPVTIANNFAFRGSQASVPRIDRLNVRSTRGPLTVRDVRLE